MYFYRLSLFFLLEQLTFYSVGGWWRPLLVKTRAIMSISPVYAYHPQSIYPSPSPYRTNNLNSTTFSYFFFLFYPSFFSNLLFLLSSLPSPQTYFSSSPPLTSPKPYFSTSTPFLLYLTLLFLLSSLPSPQTYFSFSPPFLLLKLLKKLWHSVTLLFENKVLFV